MSDLKPLSSAAVPRALEKAERYRLLNEPAEAESICLDILDSDPGNQKALVMLLLALTDRFGMGYAVGSTEVAEVLSRLSDGYERSYYSGIVCERRAKALLQQGGAGFSAYGWLSEAMGWYEKAEAIHPAGNEDAILRWNTCARIIARNRLVPPGPEDDVEHGLE